MNIVVLAGGVSTERNVSLSSGSKICKALVENGHRARILDSFFGIEGEFNKKEDFFVENYDVKSFSVSETPIDMDEIKKLKENRSELGPNVIKLCQMADIVFIALHGENGENGRIQATFDMLNIKYTGNDYLSCAISMDKAYSRTIFKENKVNVAKGYEFDLSKEELKESPVGYPCVVKIASGGSSIGVAIVKDEKEFLDAVKSMKKYEDKIVVEQFIKGRELTVGVIDGKPLPVIEIVPKTGFYDYKNKYQAGCTEEICPAEIPEEARVKISEMAVNAAKALGLKKYSRADFIMDEKGELYCLEMNALPGMTPTSLVPRAAQEVGMTYNDLCEKIISLSI